MGGMNVNKPNVQGPVYTSQTAPAGMMEAAKKKLQEAKANDFEGYQQIEPNTKDGKNVSNQASEISKNLKEASSEIKEMLKNPNAFTDCFPTLKDKKLGTPADISPEKLEKLKNLGNQVNSSVNSKEGAQEAKILTHEHAEKLKAIANQAGSSVNSMDSVQQKPALTEEQAAEKMHAMQQAMQNANTMTPMNAEESAKMAEFFNQMKQKLQD